MVQPDQSPARNTTNQVQIRVAKPADAEAIIHVHHAAVHETASPFYPSEILDGWSPKPGEMRYQWMRQMITKGDEVVIVAEARSEIVGFGLIIPKLRELRALYVHPLAGRQGIGKKILQALETHAVDHGISCLQLNASLNAEAFYRQNGYKTLSRGTLRLSIKHEMACLKMEKTINLIAAKNST
jgi:N-acetylglutamate synthase-like GNAT family acetyltransferase